MKKIGFLLFLIPILFSHKGSAHSSPGVDRIPYYTNIVFEGNFSILAEKDEHNNYYIVDLNQLKTDFERIYFETLAFQQAGLTRLDAGNVSMAWFKTENLIDTPALLTMIRNKAIYAGTSMSPAEKQEWLSTHGK